MRLHTQRENSFDRLFSFDFGREMAFFSRSRSSDVGVLMRIEDKWTVATLPEGFNALSPLAEGSFRFRCFFVLFFLFMLFYAACCTLRIGIKLCLFVCRGG